MQPNTLLKPMTWSCKKMDAKYTNSSWLRLVAILLADTVLISIKTEFHWQKITKKSNTNAFNHENCTSMTIKAWQTENFSQKKSRLVQNRWKIQLDTKKSSLTTVFISIAPEFQKSTQNSIQFQCKIFQNEIKFAQTILINSIPPNKISHWKFSWPIWAKFVWKSINSEPKSKTVIINKYWNDLSTKRQILVQIDRMSHFSENFWNLLY